MPEEACGDDPREGQEREVAARGAAVVADGLDAGAGRALHPATRLHHVRPVTRGVRLAAFFWVQSMVRDDGERTLLFDLDHAIQELGREQPDHPSAVQLIGVYHNLLRRWAEL